MSRPATSFAVRFDPANPGHVLACCGLLELAHRLWGGVEGWFEDSCFAVAVADGPDDHLSALVRKLAHCQIAGLTEEEAQERKELDAIARKQGRRKQVRQLTPEEERRRDELGKKARAGSVVVGHPFNLSLDWWNDAGTPKTWAGQQEMARIARSAQRALHALGDSAELLEYGAVAPAPFYFDARRFVHALDTGFSVDAQGMATVAHPGVELLALIGLQRFRPIHVTEERWTFAYWTWRVPLGVATAAACFAGFVDVPCRTRYRFSLRFRDDQKRYKAFGFARPYGGET